MNLAAACLVFGTSLFIPGIIGSVKAKMAGRKSPSLLQPLYDVLRLLKKGSIYSPTTTVLFRIAPSIYLATVICGALFVPLGKQSGFFSFDYDFVYFSYLLALGKFLMILAALDTGSGFEGMGANREALYSLLIEPAFFLLMGSLALLTGQTSFHDMFALFYFKGYLSCFIGALGMYLLLQIAMIENSRLLVDDPKTHLELTMVHEVMILDCSGFDLALIHMASWIKFGIFSGLIANFLLLPFFPVLLDAGIFLGVAALFGITVALLESFRARNKMAVNPPWIAAFSSVGIVIFLAALFLVHS